MIENELPGRVDQRVGTSVIPRIVGQALRLPT
jgi:hypothetical protein